MYAMQSWSSRRERWENMHDRGPGSSKWRPRPVAAEAIAKADAWTGGIGIPAMQVVNVATGDVVWRDSREYPEAGPCVGIVTAEDADDLLGLFAADDGYVVHDGACCAVRRVEERSPYEDVWTCVCGTRYITYDAGRVCFVRIVGAGFIYGQVWECDDCHRDLLRTYNGKVDLQEALF